MKIIKDPLTNEMLHIIIQSEDWQPGRLEIIEPNNFLQCAMLQLPKHTTFKPHYHISKCGEEFVIAQESWVVINGKVECIFYGLDNTVIATEVIQAGEASFTLRGGHNYRILEEDTRVLEFKTGPYKGQVLDKEFIK
jgi:hypothetical protein